MLGYFQFNKKMATHSMRMTYRSYYCGTCFALEKHYGQKARMLLSYDVVLLGIISNLGTDNTGKKLPCFGKMKAKDIYQENPKWKALAAINVLMFAAEVDDDINDENSIKARLGYLVYRRIIQKAKNDYPKIAALIDEGYRKMFEAENSGKNITVVCDIFGEFLKQVMKKAFDTSEKYDNIIILFAKWLYFIDQLDDYDDDAKKKKLNPLLIKGVTKTELIDKRHKELFGVLDYLLKDLDLLKAGLDQERIEDRIVHSILNETIPGITFMVLNTANVQKEIKSQSDWGEKI